MQRYIGTWYQQALIPNKFQAKGVAKIVEGSHNAKLRVSFFRPFYGDYWVLALGPDYPWVLVGEPSLQPQFKKLRCQGGAVVVGRNRRKTHAQVQTLRGHGLRYGVQHQALVA